MPLDRRRSRSREKAAGRLNPSVPTPRGGNGVRNEDTQYTGCTSPDTFGAPSRHAHCTAHVEIKMPCRSRHRCVASPQQFPSNRQIHPQIWQAERDRLWHKLHMKSPACRPSSRAQRPQQFLPNRQIHPYVGRQLAGCGIYCTRRVELTSL